MRQIVVLGGGTGGTLVANRLRQIFEPAEAQITVVDQDDVHVYQPGLLFVPFGLAARRRHRPPPPPPVPRRHRHRPLADRPRRHRGQPGAPRRPRDARLRRARRRDRRGARARGDRGPAGPGLDEEHVHVLRPRRRRRARRTSSATFDGGRIVVNVVDMPIKCPVAPLEFCFLADWYFRERGIREHVELIYVTPLDGAFTKPAASKALGRAARGEGRRARHRVQHRRGRRSAAASSSRTTVARCPSTSPWSCPLHGGAPYVGRSPGLGDELNFVPTDEHTLQSKVAARTSS